METTTAKTNMIKQQLRTSGILDEAILQLFDKLDRAAFVPDAYKDVAYADTMIPLSHQRVMLSPVLEAKILQAVATRSTDKVLEIGTGAGYLTALLCAQAHYVYSIDMYSDLFSQLQIQLQKYNLSNIQLQKGNAVDGWSAQQPYDIIVVTASVNNLSQALMHQLTIGGRLFIIINHNSPAMHAHLITRTSESTWQDSTLFETSVPELPGTARKSAFVF